MEASRRQCRALNREIDNALRELVREAVEDGTVVTSDVRLTAFKLAGALGWVARWYKDDGPQSATEIARMMVDGLMKGLAPRCHLVPQFQSRTRRTGSGPGLKLPGPPQQNRK